MTAFFLAVATAIGGFLGAWLSAYTRKKGENLATKEDFADLLAQVTETTRATKAIETQLAHDDWNAREWSRVRREKFEELFELIVTGSRWLTVSRDYWIFDGKVEPDRVMSGRMRMLQRLYFPELETHVAAFCREADLHEIALMKVRRQFLGMSPTDRVKVINQADAEVTERTNACLTTNHALRDEAVRIVGTLFSRTADSRG